VAGKVRVCDYCKGNRKVTVWDNKKKTYKEVTCTVCHGKGKVDISTI
jgi:DnaJ-class molecular chaperone